MQGDDAKQDRDGSGDVPQLDGFTIVRQLGHGGMATVWEARQHDPPRTVAIKLLNSDFAENPEDVENFYGEEWVYMETAPNWSALEKTWASGR